MTLIPTPSRNQLSTAEDEFPEHGLLVNDGEVTLWNQVDSQVNPEIIQQIIEKCGHIDFLHSRFVPLLEGNFAYNKPLALPFDEYCTYLNVVRALSPRMVVPGSAAFRYRDELTFLNQYSFPTTQLCALIEGNTSWDYVTLCGNYRTFNNIYRITEGGFELPPEDKSNYALEPLMDLFPWDKDMDKRKFMRDVHRWKGKSI